MIFQTKLSPHEVVSILEEQADRKVSLLKSILTLTAHVGTSAVMGKIIGDTFCLRNRRNPYLSLRVYGKIIASGQGSEIQLSFRKPKFCDFISEFLFKRNAHDQKVILNFLTEWLQITEAVDPAFSVEREDQAPTEFRP